MRKSHLSRGASLSALALAFMLTLFPATKSFAATDWSPIQSALGADGNETSGLVLRFELVRQDLALTVNGRTIPSDEVAEYANGYLAFKPLGDSTFFADGSLPAQETELAALQTALRADKHINITAVVNHAVLESPKLIWVHFEATENGADLAQSLATALKTIHSPQLNVFVIPGTNSVFDPKTLLPPKFLKLFDEGSFEQLEHIFVFYLPLPDEKHEGVGPVKAHPGLGVGQSFYIEIPSFNGGPNIATLNIELCLHPNEVQAVEDTLRAGGFKIAAQHNHFVDERYRLFFVHATATGDGFSLGNTLYDAIQIIQQDTARDRDHDGDNR